MLKMVDGTGIIGVDMVCPLGGAVSPPQPPNYDNIEMEGVGSLILPNSLKAPIERVELIGNSTQGENPAPDNPQEIKSAGRKSKNLFNIADLRVGRVQRDGTIDKTTYYRTVILDVPEDAKYRITFKINTDYNMLYFTDAYINGVYSNPYVKVYGGNSGSLISLKNGKNILSFRATKDDATIDFPKDHNIMIAAESETLDYEPYGHFLEMKITGKNLFDEEKAKDANNWTNSTILPSYKEISIYVGKGNSVNISYLENLETGLGFYANIAHSENDYTMYWLYHSDSAINITKNKNFISRNDYIILRVDGGSVPKFFEYIKTLQIEIGSRQTPYEPYTEQTMQITLDEPLRGVGEYKDVLTKDGVVRKIAPYEVDLNDLRDGGYSKTNTVMFSVKVQNKTVGYASSKPSILCNILPDCALQMSNIYNNDKECIAVGGGIVLFRVNKSRLKDISSFEAIKQSFIELMEGKKMLVEYALETPVTEPLPESVQVQLQALQSENGTTHVFVDSGEVETGIKLTYRKEK